LDPKLARILIVDDHPPSVELMSECLKGCGFEVSTAPDGNRAIALANEEWFDLVILDVHLPLYDGVEVLRILRKRHVLRPLKVIAVTGDTSESVRSELVDQGVDAYLTKPIELPVLVKLARRLCGSG
jgi:CheY-like chemotaxis protein